MNEVRSNNREITSFALVDCVSYSGTEKRQFYYSVQLGDNPKIGDIYKIQFGDKNTLGVIRKVTSTKPSNIKNIKSLGTNINLPYSIPNYYLDLADWMRDYYVTTDRAVWSCLLPSGLQSKSRLKSTKDTTVKKEKLNKLSSSQSKALQDINCSNTTLLHGITGSGKTEVYLHAIADNIKKSKSTILLVPEIMLTTQIENRLRDHFYNVVTIHSGLSIATRKKLWIECLEKSKTTPIVIIGARSALFTPLHNLGLIIVDEEHEPSYKQESSPRYDAITVAAQMSRSTKSKLILGSATPSLRSYYLSKKNIINYCELKNRHRSELPDVEIIDIKNEQSSMISQTLKTEIDKCLINKLQVLLFLNRRGSARALICNMCAQSTKCSNCNISYNYHGDINKLVCHYCNAKLMPPTKCESCGSNDLRFVGDGTKKLEADVKNMWPDAKIARIDKDNSKLDHLQQTYKDFSTAKIDIVIGTQMISRGIDIEKLHLVGVIDADSAMQIPDFSSSERAFSQICQAAGRAGRRSRKGKVIIQTRNPNNPIIKTAADQNYQVFYESEILSREKFVYPPHCYLLKLQYAHKEPPKAFAQATKLKKELSTTKAIAVLGPTQHIRRTLDRKTVYQIIVKSKQRKVLQQLAINLPSNWTADIDPVSLI